MNAEWQKKDGSWFLVDPDTRVVYAKISRASGTYTWIGHTDNKVIYHKSLERVMRQCESSSLKRAVV